MKIEQGQQGKWVCLKIIDRLDTMTAPELEEAGLKVLSETPWIALDFSELEYISSAGLRTLLLLGKKAKASSGSVVFCGLSGMVQEVVEESGVQVFFTTYQNVTELPA